ncbi:MAG: FrgA [Labilithrix sp.]|nr:FrgA [Labilithrix sp.]
MTDELTRTLLLEEVVSREAVSAALHASLVGDVPFVRALLDTRAVTPAMLARYLARAPAPLLQKVVPLMEVATLLPPGLCERLLAVPVRRDAITGTVDVVVVDASDPHPAREIGFHLRAPVRLVRAPLAAIEEGLQRLRTRSLPPPPAPATHAPHASHASLPPAAPAAPPSRQAHVLPGLPKAQRPSVTPPWGTEIHPSPPSGAPGSGHGSDAPRSGLGSEIPIPLTRRTFAAVSGGTQRPPPFVDPGNALGEGYAVDTTNFRSIVEVTEPSRIAHGGPDLSFIPGPPPVPSQGPFAAFAAQVALSDIGGILAALRAASSRDEVLELVLTGARVVAHKVGIFVVKRGGYHGWSCTPELGDRARLQAVLVPLEGPSVFEEAVRDGLYLGPIPRDEVHAPLLDVMHGASRDVAVVPIRVSGKTAVVILADELGDTMLATRRLEELARVAGEAFARIVRLRR